MKLPFTEKFLWDLYNLINPDKPVKIRFLPTSWSELIYPEYIQLKKEYERKQDRERFRKIIYYLKKKGWIKIKAFKGKEGILITLKGQKKLLNAVKKTERRSMELEKRKDGRWQMVMYDIPSDKNKKRNSFRECLRELGYQMLQKSIMVSPYNVLEETKLLIKHFDFEDYVRLLFVREKEI